MKLIRTALAVLLAATLQAAPLRVDFDPATTQVRFSLPATLHTVHGELRIKPGSLVFDPATGEATGQIVADATSAHTGNDGRDRRMHREILETGSYPEIVFHAAHASGEFHAEGDSQLDLRGVFRIHGTDHEVTLPVRIHMERGQFNAIITFAVPYVKWGIKNPSTLLLRVNDTVEVTIQASGRLAN